MAERPTWSARSVAVASLRSLAQRAYRTMPAILTGRRPQKGLVERYGCAPEGASGPASTSWMVCVISADLFSMALTLQ